MNGRPETLKLLEEAIGSKLSGMVFVIYFGLVSSGKDNKN